MHESNDTAPENQRDDTTPEDQRDAPLPLHRRRLSMFGRSVHLPANRFVRVGLGVLLCLGGLLWFLPVVGIWMLPLGLAVLSVDIPFVRRHSRRAYTWFRRRYPVTMRKLFPRSHRR